MAKYLDSLKYNKIALNDTRMSTQTMAHIFLFIDLVWQNHGD